MPNSNQYNDANAERNRAILTMLEKGMSQGEAAAALGFSKNVVSGVWTRAGRGAPMHDAKTTMLDRLDALHAKMNAVLAQTVGVGRMKEPEQKPRPSFGNLF